MLMQLYTRLNAQEEIVYAVILSLTVEVGVLQAVNKDKGGKNNEQNM